MGELDDVVTARDYPWLITLDESILLCMDHLDVVRGSDSELVMGVHLKMASRALRCALEVYAMRFEKEKT